MTKQIERLSLAGASPGTRREILVHRYGSPGAAVGKAYLQASIHADETPALLVAHHLLRLLDKADRAGLIEGEILLVPTANPIGLDQFFNARHNGRYEAAGGGNFNRNWPDLVSGLGARVEGLLTGDADANIAVVRQALRDRVADLPEVDELQSLRKTLLGLACDADLVLDLHCDDEALMHLYLLARHWPEAADLAADLGCEAVLLADDSGGGPFDECCSTPWLRLAAANPELPIPPACLSGTVELRGRADVSDNLAKGDARALYHSLQRRGFIAGEAPPPPPAKCQATALGACEVVKAPASGVLAYCVEPGDEVRRGEVVAWLVDPTAEDPAEGRQAILSGTNGIVLSRRDKKYARAGWSIAKIVGEEPLESRHAGSLLES